MSALGDAYYNIRADTTRLPSDLRQAEGVMKGSLGRIAETAAGALAAIGIYKLLGQVRRFVHGMVHANAELERFTIALGVMMQDSAKAKQLIRDLYEFSERTPFAPQQLVQVSTQMMAFGFEAEEVVGTLRSIGDVAAGLPGGMQAGLQRSIYYIGQMKAMGRVTGESMRMMSMAGIGAWEALANYTGKTITELQKEVSDGKVTFDEFWEAWKVMQQTRYGGLMEKESKTWEGLISTLIGKWDIFKQKIGEGVFEVAKDQLIKLLEYMETADFVETTERIRDGLVEVASKVAVITRTLWEWAPAFSTVAKHVGVLMAMGKFILILKAVTAKTWALQKAAASAAVAYKGLALAIQALAAGQGILKGLSVATIGLKLAFVKLLPVLLAVAAAYAAWRYVSGSLDTAAAGVRRDWKEAHSDVKPPEDDPELHAELTSKVEAQNKVLEAVQEEYRQNVALIDALADQADSQEEIGRIRERNLELQRKEIELEKELAELQGRLGELADPLDARGRAVKEATEARDALKKAIEALEEARERAKDVGDISEEEWTRRADELTSRRAAKEEALRQNKRETLRQSRQIEGGESWMAYVPGVSHAARAALWARRRHDRRDSAELAMLREQEQQARANAAALTQGGALELAVSEAREERERKEAVEREALLAARKVEAAELVDEASHGKASKQVEKAADTVKKLSGHLEAGALSAEDYERAVTAVVHRVAGITTANEAYGRSLRDVIGLETDANQATEAAGRLREQYLRQVFGAPKTGQTTERIAEFDREIAAQERKVEEIRERTHAGGDVAALAELAEAQQTLDAMGERRTEAVADLFEQLAGRSKSPLERTADRVRELTNALNDLKEGEDVGAIFERFVGMDPAEQVRKVREHFAELRAEMREKGADAAALAAMDEMERDALGVTAIEDRHKTIDQREKEQLDALEARREAMRPELYARERDRIETAAERSRLQLEAATADRRTGGFVAFEGLQHAIQQSMLESEADKIQRKLQELAEKENERNQAWHNAGHPVKVVNRIAGVVDA